MSKNLPQLTDAEFKKVLRALAIIEEAQNLINRAAQELCPVNGFANEWTASHKVHDAIKAYWHRVKDRYAVLWHEELHRRGATASVVDCCGGDANV